MQANDPTAIHQRAYQMGYAAGLAVGRSALLIHCDLRISIDQPEDPGIDEFLEWERQEQELLQFAADTFARGFAALIPVTADEGEYPCLPALWGCYPMEKDNQILERGGAGNTADIEYFFDTKDDIPTKWVKAIAVRWPLWRITLTGDDGTQQWGMRWDGQEWEGEHEQGAKKEPHI